MSERPPEEGLSRTLLDVVRDLAASLATLSAAFAVVGTLGLVLGVAVLIFISDLSLYGYIILGIGGGLVLTSMIVSFRTVAGAAISRRGKYGTNTLVMVSAFIGLAAVGNFLAFENSWREDVTATKQFSLFPRTADLLKDLEDEIEVKAFFVPADDEPTLRAFENQVEDLLHEFDVRSTKFSYEFIDPVENPQITRGYGVTRFPSIVFENKDSGTRHLVPLSVRIEQDFVTGLLIVTGQEQKVVYFLTGHGERDILDTLPDSIGFGNAFDGIVAENYDVSLLNLFLDLGKQRLKRDLCHLEEQATGQDGGNGEPCRKKVNMVVVAGPTENLLEGEAEVLHDYLKSGGKMLFLVDPETPQTFREFLARWGIEVGEGHIIDRQRSVGDNNEILFLGSDQYLDFIPQLTGPLEITYFPGATSLKPMKGVTFFPPTLDQDEEQNPDEIPTIVGTALAVTSLDSWLIKDPTRNTVDTNVDLNDIFFPAVAIRALAPLGEELPPNLEDVNPASLLIFGDSDFASNRYFFTASNNDLFLNSVNWLVGDEALIGIKPKPITFRELVLTRNERDVVRYTGWLLLPALMAVAGGFVWWRRR